MVCFFSLYSLCPLNLFLSIDSSCYIVLLFKNDNCLDLHLDQLLNTPCCFHCNSSFFHYFFFVIVAHYLCFIQGLLCFILKPFQVFFLVSFFLLSLLIVIKVLIFFFLLPLKSLLKSLRTSSHRDWIKCCLHLENYSMQYQC